MLFYIHQTFIFCIYRYRFHIYEYIYIFHIYIRRFVDMYNVSLLILQQLVGTFFCCCTLYICSNVKSVRFATFYGNLMAPSPMPPAPKISPTIHWPPWSLNNPWNSDKALKRPCVIGNPSWLVATDNTWQTRISISKNAWLSNWAVKNPRLFRVSRGWCLTKLCGDCNKQLL